jgi:hypothetical protein
VTTLEEIDALASELEVQAHNEGVECERGGPHEATPKAARKALLAAVAAALLAAEQRGAEGAEREAAHWKQTALTIQTNLAAQHRDECRSEWRRGHTEAFEDAATAYEGALREIGGLATYRDGADSYTTLGRKLDAIRARAIAAETGRTE